MSLHSIPWMTVAEQLPAEKTVVIISVSTPEKHNAIFAGWLEDGRWKRVVGGSPVVEDYAPLRATDWWLSLPEWEPECVYRGGYPA